MSHWEGGCRAGISRTGGPCSVTAGPWAVVLVGWRQWAAPLAGYPEDARPASPVPTQKGLRWPLSPSLCGSSCQLPLPIIRRALCSLTYLSLSCCAPMLLVLGPKAQPSAWTLWGHLGSLIAARASHIPLISETQMITALDGLGYSHQVNGPSFLQLNSYLGSK